MRVNQLFGNLLSAVGLALLPVALGFVLYMQIAH